MCLRMVLFQPHSKQVTAHAPIFFRGERRDLLQGRAPRCISNLKLTDASILPIKPTSSPDVDQQFEAVRGRNVANKDKVTFTNQTTNDRASLSNRYHAMQCRWNRTFFSFIFLERSQNSLGKRKKNCGEAKSMWKSNLFTWNNEIIKERKLTVAACPFCFSLLLIPPETPDTISGYKYSPVATVLG